LRDLWGRRRLLSCEVDVAWWQGRQDPQRNVKDTARGKEGTACAGGTCLGTAARANMLYGVIMAVSDQRSATSSPKLVMLACDDFRQPTDLTSEGIEDVSWFITVHRYGPYVWKGRAIEATLTSRWLTGLTCSAGLLSRAAATMLDYSHLKLLYQASMPSLCGHDEAV
jgi:hypothetical protein